ncbi:class I SAM-dependent methyltransferase [Edaphocola flava]|uniref:class I SAM-dependent methyltransferase n=1 Tax=Edaphocola flava TaxID=2499629 RepID=UPI00100C1BF1|nr:class I SAM-dependent methyltransferase [Edaphocola flava]
MKDLFSQHSADYARYRPQYPEALYKWLADQVPAADHAWDCATGNGQLARHLSLIFKQVEATDISAQQLKEAPQLPNVRYSVQPAEQTDFPDHTFDLITVAQAIHWFDFNGFYEEVKRTAKPGALLLVTGYGNLKVTNVVDQIIAHLYDDILGPYWDPERKYVDEEYKTIPFPFTDIKVPHFPVSFSWSLEHLIAYLNTWSAVKHYEKKHGENPVDSITEALKHAWGTAAEHSVHFPLLLRAGRI